MLAGASTGGTAAELKKKCLVIRLAGMSCLCSLAQPNNSAGILQCLLGRLQLTMCLPGKEY